MRVRLQSHVEVRKAGRRGEYFRCLPIGQKCVGPWRKIRLGGSLDLANALVERGDFPLPLRSEGIPARDLLIGQRGRFRTAGIVIFPGPGLRVAPETRLPFVTQGDVLRKFGFREAVNLLGDARKLRFDFLAHRLLEFHLDIVRTIPLLDDGRARLLVFILGKGTLVLVLGGGGGGGGAVLHRGAVDGAGKSGGERFSLLKTKMVQYCQDDEADSDDCGGHGAS